MNLSNTAKITLIIVLLLIAGGVVWFFSYKNDNADPISGLKPQLEVAVGRVSAITDSTLDLSLNLLLHNPLPVGLDVASMAYTIKMGETTIIEDNYARPFVVKASDSSSVSIATTLNLKNLIEEINRQDRIGNDSADYHIEGVFHLREPFLGKDTLRLSLDKRMFVYHLPEIEAAGFDLDKFSLGQSEVLLKLKVTNNNPFSIEFKNPTYSIDLGKQGNVLEGTMTGGTKVDKNSSETFEIPFEVDMAELLKMGGQLILQGKSLPFRLDFNCTLASDNSSIDGSALHYIVEGDLGDLQKLGEMIKKK